MVTLADLRVRNVLPTWHEAVAVVQELVHTVHATTGSSDNLPGPEGVRLLPGGEVLAAPGSARAEHPVCRAAGLLALLTEGVPMPGELQALVEANLATPPTHATVDAFSTALAFFERPHRRADVETLVARVMESAAHADAAAELERLRARVFGAAEAAPVARPEPEPAPRRAGLWVAAAAIVLLAAAAGGAYAVWPGLRSAMAGAGGSDASESPSLLGQARDGLAGAVEQAKVSLGLAKPPSQAAAAPPAVAEATPAAPVRRRASRAPVPAAVEAWEEDDDPAIGTMGAPPPPPSPGEVPAVQTQPLAPGLDPTTAAGTVQLAHMVYTSGHADVRPPSLVRPALRAVEAGTAGDRVATLDLLLDEAGNVERVTMTPQAQTYHERMYLAHAKAWKFEPATRDGQPVRYRLTMRVRL
jgi:hypothetical protein